MKAKVALVTMPFISPVRPSIGLSLLQAEVRADGHECDVLYLNLHFLNHVRLETYLALSEAATRALLGEWVFSKAALGVVDEEGYWQTVLANYPRYLNTTISREALLEMRQAVEPYLEDCLTSIPWEKYDVIGFSTTYEQNCASLALARKLKERWPDKQIIFGGANCDGPMGLVLLEAFPFIDAVCLGEGDIAFPAYVAAIAGRDTFHAMPEIPGIAIRRNMPENVPTVAAVSDLNKLPLPIYDDFFQQFADVGLEGILQPYVLFESSRGCWWGQKAQCRFCGLNGSNIHFRSKKPEHVYAEITELHARYGRETTLFSAVDNILDYEYFDWLLPKIADLPYQLQFFYETKANLQKKQLEILLKAGIWRIQPGIESLNTGVLRKISKGVSMLQNVRLLKWCKEYGIVPGWNIIYGFPGEEMAAYQEMAILIEKLTHLTPPKNVGPFRLSRFSPYFEEPDRYGIQNVQPGAIYRYIYPTLTKEQLWNLAYYFEFTYIDGRDPQVYTEKMRQAAEKWQAMHSQAEMCYIRTEQGMRIVDTRKGEPRVQELTNLQAQIYLFCDDIATPAKIAQKLGVLGFSVEHELIKTTLEAMVHEGWMIKEGDRFLALAIPLGELQRRKLHGISE